MAFFLVYSGRCETYLCEGGVYGDRATAEAEARRDNGDNPRGRYRVTRYLNAAIDSDVWASLSVTQRDIVDAARLEWAEYSA